jgi:predicted RNA-binding Zn-ribbon protein involved in translation (DUF1610 family)
MNDNNNRTPEHSSGAPEAYNRILDRLRERLDRAGEYSWDYLQQQIEEAAEIELAAEEMTRDEMDLLKAYIRRDLDQLGYYIHETGSGLAAWLNFDLDILEQKMLQRLLDLADRTRVDYELLREQLGHSENEYLAGEITAPGTLECLACGETQRLTRTSAIQPCRCGAVLFRRCSDARDQQRQQQQ